MLITRIRVLVPAVMLLAPIVSAEDDVNAVPAVSLAPLEAMQALAPLEGDWDMTVHVSPDDGKTWSETPPQRVNVSFEHKGFLLDEIPADLNVPGFHMRTFLSYDQYRKVYRKAALDDVWGILDLYEGTIEDNQLVLTNLKAGTFFPVGEGKWRGFRLTVELKASHRWMWVDKTDDEGASWQPAFKVEYRQRNSG